MNDTVKIDILDIIFEGKNKEYGAYVLRKTYPKTLTRAIVIAVTFFLIAVSAPLIATYLAPKEKVGFTTKKKVDLKEAALESKKMEQKKLEIPIEKPKESLTETIKFTAPVIKPDDEVKDTELMVSVQELQKVDPGKQTQQGNMTGDLGDVDLTVDVNKQESVVKEDTKKETMEVFTWAEEMPTFPGGEEKLMTFLRDNIQYPEIAKRAGVEGRVTVQFIVNTDGKIMNISVLKGIGAGCDEEAIRVIKQMPKWKPGLQNGKPVAVQVSIPILFQLQ